MSVIISLITFLVFLPFPMLAQAVEIRSGCATYGATFFGARYEHWTNSSINGAFAATLEKSHAQGLNYTAFSADLRAEYVPNRQQSSVNPFNWRAAIGGTVIHEQEPRIYPDQHFWRQINYGIIGEATAECWLSDQFCLSVFVQQKYLFNTALGHTRFAFGLGLKFHLDN